jgi:hypothetical protein
MRILTSPERLLFQTFALLCITVPSFFKNQDLSEEYLVVINFTKSLVLDGMRQAIFGAQQPTHTVF